MTNDHIVADAGDKVEMDSYTEEPRAVYSEKMENSFHDDADPGTGTAEVGKGLQRNLQARHLTMISLGKFPFASHSSSRGDRPDLQHPFLRRLSFAYSPT